MNDLARLAELVKTKNAIDQEITAVIGRPALIGHSGEYIAAHIFHIALEESAVAKGIDGRFGAGGLAGSTVNIKWYAKLEGLLDLTPESLPDYYLVLAGPRSPAASSRGETRPWLIRSVFLFDARGLVDALGTRGVKLGIATSVARQYWDGAEIYPTQTNDRLVLSDEQRGALALFR